LCQADDDRTGRLGLTDYYAKAFKTGFYPIINKDKIFMWSRTHPANVNASEDPVAKPTNFDVVCYPLFMDIS